MGVFWVAKTLVCEESESLNNIYTRIGTCDAVSVFREEGQKRCGRDIRERMLLGYRVSSPLLALAAGQFGMGIMHVLFMFYYVKVFLNVFHVPVWWFNLAQSLFMVWNAINDPLFGYMQDSSRGWLASRTVVIRRFGLPLALSFLLLWWPWTYVNEGGAGAIEGLHLIVALFAYDACFSVVGVAWSALFADTTKQAAVRVQAMKWGQVAILLSVNAVAVTEKMSHSLEDMSSFRGVMLGAAVIGCVCLMVCGSLRSQLPYSREDGERLLEKDDEGKVGDESTWDRMRRLSRQVVWQRDFLAIVATNFIHQARSTCHMNFASIATELLISQESLPKGSARLSAFYLTCTLAPQVVVIVCSGVVARWGAFRVVMAAHVLSVAAGGLAILAGGGDAVVMVFMLVDSIAVHSAAPLFNILISDFIDDDQQRFGRRTAISSLVFSLNALIVKPAQSIGPMLVVHILDKYGYQAYLSSKVPSEDLVSSMRAVLYATPLIFGGLQYVMFRKYGLRNKHLGK